MGTEIGIGIGPGIGIALELGIGMGMGYLDISNITENLCSENGWTCTSLQGLQIQKMHLTCWTGGSRVQKVYLAFWTCASF